MILVTAISVLDYGIDMSIINLTHDIIDQFKKHGESDYPHECCGFILGNFKDTESIGVEYIPASNTKEEKRERRFLICHRINEKASLPVFLFGVGSRKVFEAKRFIPFEISQYKSAAFMGKVFFSMG